MAIRPVKIRDPNRRIPLRVHTGIIPTVTEEDSKGEDIMGDIMGGVDIMGGADIMVKIMVRVDFREEQRGQHVSLPPTPSA